MITTNTTENKDPVTEAIAEKRLPRYETAVYELGLGKKFVSKKPSSRTCFVYFPIDNSILAGANYGFQPRTVARRNISNETKRTN